MMDTRVRRLALKIPLDVDGFLRRECPHCEREFKRIVGKVSDSKATHPATGGLYCPYCGLQAPHNRWLTKSQVEFTKNVVANHVAQRKSHLGLRTLNVLAQRAHSKSTSGVPVEPNDMKLVSFACHPHELIKVYEHWIGVVHCIVCDTKVTM